MELYRKYRPMTFEQVIGQNHITGTLINQVEKKRVGHAYLFTGTRGTGKTTCAKIFARAINCLNPQDGSPCGECAVCKSLLKGGNLDVIEMDAASNNGVDSVRDIIEQIKYPPVNGSKKVYIIDEVHMLSPGAFNAFLKTLEEPPSYVVFILATTEVHKLPQTVVSRCMRFDFRLVPTAQIRERVKEVYDGEGIEYESDALDLIAQAGEGSVRDALSIADRCVKLGEKVTYDDVADVLGTSKKTDIYALFDSVSAGQIGDALKVGERINKQGKIPSVVAKDLVSFCKDVLLCKTAGATSLSGSDESKREIELRAERTTINTLVGIIKIFSSIDADLRYSTSPAVTFEMALVRAAKMYDEDYSSLEERVSRLERHGVTAAPAEKEPEQKKTLNESRPMDAQGIWGRVTTYFRQNESMSFYSAVGAQTDVRIDGENLVVSTDPISFETLVSPACHDALIRALKDDGVNLRIVVEIKKGGVDMDKEAERMQKLVSPAPINVIKK